MRAQGARDNDNNNNDHTTTNNNNNNDDDSDDGHAPQQQAYAAGGLLFRCSECPKAFCEDHLPLEAEMVGPTCERWTRRVFILNRPKS